MHQTVVRARFWSGHWQANRQVPSPYSAHTPMSLARLWIAFCSRAAPRFKTCTSVSIAMEVSGFGCLFSVCSPVASEAPSFTNHPKLQQLALVGDIDDIFPELARLPTLAPSSLVGICADIWYTASMTSLEEIPDSQWKAIDLALCNTKFPHLESIEFVDQGGATFKNPHAFFQRVLPKSYERGIIWLRPRRAGMYLIAIMLPPSDLHRPTYSHRSRGCPAIPRTTSRMG